MTPSLEILLLDVGDAVRGYDCRDVLGVEEADAEGEASPGRYVVHLGRLGPAREVRCRGILGSVVLMAGDLRRVPAALCERMNAEKPWAVGITESGLCLLY